MSPTRNITNPIFGKTKSSKVAVVAKSSKSAKSMHDEEESRPSAKAAKAASYHPSGKAGKNEVQGKASKGGGDSKSGKGSKRDPGDYMKGMMFDRTADFGKSAGWNGRCSKGGLGVVVAASLAMIWNLR